VKQGEEQRYCCSFLFLFVRAQTPASFHPTTKTVTIKRVEAASVADDRSCIGLAMKWLNEKD
jgi:hypothetical protein